MFKVLGPLNISFLIKDRYSSMRSFQSTLKKELARSYNFKLVPDFPKKKYVMSMDPKFLNQRMTELERFFNALLENP